MSTAFRHHDRDVRGFICIRRTLFDQTPSRMELWLMSLRVNICIHIRVGVQYRQVRMGKALRLQDQHSR